MFELTGFKAPISGTVGWWLDGDYRLSKNFTVSRFILAVGLSAL